MSFDFEIPHFSLVLEENDSYVLLSILLKNSYLVVSVGILLTEG